MSKHFDDECKYSKYPMACISFLFEIFSIFSIFYLGFLDLQNTATMLPVNVFPLYMSSIKTIKKYTIMKSVLEKAV